MNSLNDVLDTMSAILGRCFLMGYAALLVGCGVAVWGSAWVNRIGQWFGLTARECAIADYGALGVLKILVIVFFLIPYIAIRLVVRKRKFSVGSGAKT